MVDELSRAGAGGTGIVQPLLQWFRKTNRDLPWRRTYDPYHVWISEIMLQQTQMDRGVAYFMRWINRFPDVQAVAKATEQEILKYWEGLGYYARARNLHRAAGIIAAEFAGEVPCDYKILLGLPGIGPYTAAAIASVAGNCDVAVIDANVTRVYARLFDIKEPVRERRVHQRLAEIAEKLLPRGQARAYNQALMDFGGLICTPKKPGCTICPVAGACAALQAGTVAERPMPVGKKEIITQRRVAGIIKANGRIFIQQRQSDDVWGGLWEFPGGEVIKGEEESSLGDRIFQDTGLSVQPLELIARVNHQYTHHKIILYCFLCALNAGNGDPVLRSASSYRWIYPEQLEQFAFPAGPRKVLELIRTKKLLMLDALS